MTEDSLSEEEEETNMPQPIETIELDSDSDDDGEDNALGVSPFSPVLASPFEGSC